MNESKIPPNTSQMAFTFFNNKMKAIKVKKMFTGFQ